MKLSWLLLLAVLLVSVVSFPILFIHNGNKTEPSGDEFFFGVSFGGDTVSQAESLIDKVKGYTNFFLVNNWDITSNETALTEIVDYAVDANLSTMVFYDFIHAGLQPWLETAKDRWGNKFLGVYLYDEPGGKQVDMGQWRSGPTAAKLFENVSDYSDAATRFTTAIPSTDMQFVKSLDIPVFTSDYALYWFDYMAQYDTVFAHFGWNHSRTQHIALCRGAANVQDKDWGAIITWTYNESPYIESGAMILQDMITAYRTGAKYVVVFDFPYDELFGILEEEHFAAMEAFWKMTLSSHNGGIEKVEADVAFVLPKDYGWGMRAVDDKIWGVWQADAESPLIWENMNKLIEKYGLKLDIIYDDPQFNYLEKYAQVYYWNSTILESLCEN